jgi:hypothetical protein
VKRRNTDFTMNPTLFPLGLALLSAGCLGKSPAHAALRRVLRGAGLGVLLSAVFLKP